VSALLKGGNVTGASDRNWDGYGKEISLDSGLPAECKALLSDPQTSGGLLVSCSAETVPEVMAVFKLHGFDDAAVVGHIGELQNARLIVN
jgi:selenide,water dikinase